MGRLVIIVCLLLATVTYAADMDSSSVFMARSIYERLGIDTSGSARLPTYLARECARKGIYQVGIDLGQEASKSVIIAANKGAALLDTQVIRIAGVSYDSLGITRRWLQAVPYDTLNRFSGEISASRNAARYALFADSLLVGPVSSNADTFGVRYYKMTNYQATDSGGTNLPLAYRDLAIQWGCFVASQILNNGRADEFRKVYNEMVAQEWQKRQ